MFLAEANRLAPETRQAMLLAAAGEGAPAAEILAAAAASRLSQDDFAAAERARLLVLKDNRFSFRHPLIGSALYEAADFASRAAAHKVLATVTEDPARRTRHRAAATVGWDEEIARELDDAALKASRRGAKSEAVAAWRRAAELSPSAGARARRLVEAAEAARQGGDPQLCGRLLDEAQPAETDVATLLQFARTEWVLSMTADYRVAALSSYWHSRKASSSRMLEWRSWSGQPRSATSCRNRRPCAHVSPTRWLRRHKTRR